MMKMMAIFVAILICFTGCAKMRAAGWYSDYGITREDLGKKESIPALIRALRDRNLYVRIYSARELGKFGENAKTAITGLFATLSSPTPQLRMESLHSLSLIGLEGHKEKLPFLSKFLRDSNSGVRLYASSAVATLGEDALSTAPLLMALSDDEHPKVRREAMLALYKVNYREQDFRVKLENIKNHDENIFNRATAEELLAKLNNTSQKTGL